MDDVFLRLMESTGVPDDARADTLTRLHALQTRYPGETPARLFARARREGAAIPPSRCAHGVVHGECVTCNSKIGERFYYTSGGRHLHTRPTCEALAAGQDRVAGWGGNPAPIEVVRTQAGVADVRDPCSVCFGRAPRRAAPRRQATPAASKPARLLARAAPLPKGPQPLDPALPPAIGDEIDWGGFTGVVASVTDNGVSLAVNGVTLTAQWGDRARVRPKSS